jgi:DNA-binding NarL/FixJ family response regulator
MDESRPTATTAAERKRTVRRLTPRELQIVKMLADDMSERQIAEEFGTCYQTVKNQVRSVRRLLAIERTTGLVAYLLRQKIIT